MDDRFKIFIEQLTDGRIEKIRETFEPQFLDISEEDLVFNQPVKVQGEAYIAERELVLHWNVQTKALIVCSICNDLVEVPIDIENFYFSEPIADITSGLYNFKELLRETILLEVPSFVECNQGNCPKRREFSKFLKKPSNTASEEEGYHPFADLDWKS